MSEKLVWSNTMTQDYLAGLPENQLRVELEDFGYEEDMLATLDYDGLQKLVYDDDYMWQNDAEEFEYEVGPEIANQTYDGIVLLVGKVGSWSGRNNAGIACQAEDLVGGNICRDCDNIRLWEQGDHSLLWEAAHHDGTHVMELYALPEDIERRKEFVIKCMPGAIEDGIGYDGDVEANAEGVADTLNETIINDYCYDFAKIPEICDPIKASMAIHNSGPATNGEPIEVYREGLEDKLWDCIYDGDLIGQVRAANEEEAYAKMEKKFPEVNYGKFDGVAIVEPAEEVQNEDLSQEQIDEISKGIKDAEKNWVHPTAKERKAGPGYGGVNEAKSKNPENLAMELQSIKDDYEDFGPDGFYAVPFERFERQYPEFTKSCIMTYLKELEILEPEELANKDIFDEYWQSGELIIPEDWPILIDGATRLSTDRADKGYTWITLLKKYQRPYDEQDEALEEDAKGDELMKRYQSNVKLHGADDPETKRSADEWNAHLEKNKHVNEDGKFGDKTPEEGQEFVAQLYDDGLGRDRAFSRELEDYGFYQGDVILEDEDAQEKLDEIGAKEGDKIVLKVVYNDPEDVEMYGDTKWTVVVDRLA